MFNEETIENVWSQARKVENFDGSIVRKDPCGAWIIKNQYGNRDSIYGWEIDHILPKSLGGGDDLFNLRATQWENNLKKGDHYPTYLAAVKSDGTKNVHEETEFTVNKNTQEYLKNAYNK